MKNVSIVLLVPLLFLVQIAVAYPPNTKNASCLSNGSAVEIQSFGTATILVTIDGI